MGNGLVFKLRPRTQNAFERNGKPLVAKVPHRNGDYVPTTVNEALCLLGGLDKAVQPGDQVLIKPNFNCSYALPLSTDLAFLAAAIEVLQDAGAEVTVGEMSGKADGPTEDVITRLGVLPVLKRYGVGFVDFEKDEWIPLEIKGAQWHSFRVPRTIYEAEKRVYLANMRCHSSARFTASLKLGVGWIDLKDRERLHADRALVEAKVAELNLGWQPNLILMDGRRSTVSAYGRGEYVYPDVVMASGDMVAIDTETVRILQQYPEENLLDVPAEEMGQLKTAQELGLGSMDYVVIEAEARTCTEQEARF
jgi:uncharacterized protein (DUF362 family)